LIKTPYLTQCPWKSHKTNELWMSQATMFLHDMWFYFQFWCSKTSRITRKTPAKKIILPQLLKSHTIKFSRTHLIKSLTANRMTNARSLNNSLQLEFWTSLESKKC
jgi:hypothetical protein